MTESSLEKVPAAPEPGDSPSARLERVPYLARRQIGWVVILSAMYMCDFADIYSLSYAAPAMRETWELSNTELGALWSYTFLGMAFGAVVGGRLSDRFGRRNTMIYSGLLFSLGSIACAVAPNYATFGLLRFVTAAGLQSALGVVLVYVVEMFPRASRGRYLSLVIALGALGMPLIAMAARAIVPLGPESWRWVFAIGAVGLVPVVLAKFLPESVRWDELRGNRQRAQSLVTEIEREITSRFAIELPDPSLATRDKSLPVTELFSRKWRRRTLVSSAVMVFVILGFYGFNNWVPTLLVDRGFSVSAALTVSTVISFAPFIGSLAAIPVTDRWQRRWMCLIVCCLIAAGMLVFAFTQNYVVLLGSGFFVSFLLLTNSALLYAYLPEVFPTALRGVGAGVANGAGRVAGIVSGLVIAAIAARFGFGGVFTATAVFMLLAGLILGFFGENTSNRGLDEINAGSAERSE